MMSATLAMPHFVTAQEVRDIVFPVDGEHNFSDSYGDPRSGGRVHLGVDIMAEKMTPLVSAVDGYVSYLTASEPAWGYALYITDADRYSYRYLHINNDTPGTDDGNGGTLYAFAPTIQRGARVVAGQLVGWVGDSGNAETVGSHLHFEIWTPDGSSINSYLSLIAATQPEESGSAFQFNRDLELRDEGQDVYELQKYLNQAGYVVAASGAGSPGNETTYFGPATQAALIKFQQAHGISPAAGYFGPVTRGVVNRSGGVQGGTASGIQPGWLVKNKKFAEIFYVEQDLKLRWIINEQAAEKHFGSTWSQDIKEFDDLGSMGLKFGENLE